MGKPTHDQEIRARRIVGETLGVFAFSTSPDDPGAKFGYECALAAIMEGDVKERELRANIAHRDDVIRQLRSNRLQA